MVVGEAQNQDFPTPPRPTIIPRKECRTGPRQQDIPSETAHCPPSNVLNAVGAEKSCRLWGVGGRGRAGGTQNEEIHSTRMPEFTETLPTAAEHSPLLPPQRHSGPQLSPPSPWKDPGPFSRPCLTLRSPTCLDQKKVEKRSEAQGTEGSGQGFPFSLHFGWRSPALVHTISMISPLWARPFVPLGVSLPEHNPAKFPLNTQSSVCCWTCSFLSFRPGIF